MKTLFANTNNTSASATAKASFSCNNTIAMIAGSALAVSAFFVMLAAIIGRISIAILAIIISLVLTKNNLIKKVEAVTSV